MFTLLSLVAQRLQAEGSCWDEAFFFTRWSLSEDGQQTLDTALSSSVNVFEMPDVTNYTVLQPIICL